MNNKWLILIVAGGLFAQALQAQDKQDPASDTKIIEETLNKIRNVENLDRYIQENQALKAQNKTLGEQIASLNKQIGNLTKQINELTQKLATENERMRQQLLQIPPFEIKSKLVGASKSMAVLQIGDKTVRIRDNVEMSVPVANGVWTLLKVEKISNELIELYFPELDRRITLYD